MVAVTLGLDNESGNNGGINGTETIANTLTNETVFLSVSNETRDDYWPSQIISDDGDDEAVVVVAELHALEKEVDACQNVLWLLLIIKAALLGVSLLLEIFMARLALRGTMWDVHPRRFMEYVLYSRLRTKLLFFPFFKFYLKTKWPNKAIEWLFVSRRLEVSLIFLWFLSLGCRIKLDESSCFSS